MRPGLMLAAFMTYDIKKPRGEWQKGKTCMQLNRQEVQGHLWSQNKS